MLHQTLGKCHAKGKRLLFWDEQATGLFAPLLNLFGISSNDYGRGQPQDHRRLDVPWASREELAHALQIRTAMNPTGGDVLESYFGFAICRICGMRLGARDFFGYGFVWPEGADHYILAHNVWTPECDEMLTTVRRLT